MGSWVSLSTWKRTSRDDSVRALRRRRHTPVSLHPGTAAASSSPLLCSYPFWIRRLFKILANLLRLLKFWVMSSFLVPSSILIWASA